MIQLLIKWALGTLALFATVKLTGHVTYDNLKSLFIAVLIIGTVNQTIGPFLQLIMLPVSVLTLGIGYLAVSIAVTGVGLILAAKILPGMHVDSAMGAMVTAAIYGVIRFLFKILF